MDNKPTVMRVGMESGKNMSLKMQLGKKTLHEDPEIARMLYKTIVLNGFSYCRRHAMASCHLCQVDNSIVNCEVDEERKNLGLRPGGDPALNKKSETWERFIHEKQAEANRKVELLCHQYGKNHMKTHPQHWIKFMTESKMDEQETNKRFLADVAETMSTGASQCCYWACQTTATATSTISATGGETTAANDTTTTSSTTTTTATTTASGNTTKLLRCAGCGLAKYCCKEHQKLDWAWEHKGECMLQLPAFFKHEMERDRQKNLSGDYSNYDNA